MAARAFKDAYHSIHEQERNEAIEARAESAEPGADRELIELFHDCQWRTTRLRVARALGRRPTSRSLQFLFRLARTPGDLPMAEAALWALGQSRHRLAGRFLSSFLPACSDELRPAVVSALGQVPERSAAPALLDLLPEAIGAGRWALVKNLVLALGELKSQEALPLLRRLATSAGGGSGPGRYVALGALVSIGKIAREPSWVDPCEPFFRDDALEHQIFRGVRTQVRFRAQWKLEDYLTKLFESSAIHPALPLELNHFPAADVRAGLGLFREPKHHARLCLALSGLDFPGMADWYAELFDVERLGPAEAAAVLESVSARLDAGMAPLLGRLRAVAYANPGEPVLRKWLEAVSMALPRADAELGEFFASEVYRALGEEGRIDAINQLANHGLSVQAVPARLQAVGKLLGSLIESDPAPVVRARALRAHGDLGLAGTRALAFAKECLAGADVPSGLAFAESSADKGLQPALLALCAAQTKEKPSPALVRALAAQERLPEKDAGLDRFLDRCLADGAPPEARRQALRLLAGHPRKARLADVVRGLRAAEAPLQLEAVIAAKAFGDGALAEELAPLLASPVQSVVGRALDALTSLPGTRAKRIAIDFLRDHPDDPDVCDKLIRCLEAPETPSDYFTGVIDAIVKAHPAHPQLDGLGALRERLAAPASASAAGAKKTPAGPDIAAIDRELGKRIEGYAAFDETAKAALRSAELPFLHPEMFDESVDKSACVVEYCKAIDIVLERELGRRILFPKLESSLHAFQNAIHAAFLNEDPPSAERVLGTLGLNAHFTAQTLPVHKMGQLAQAVLSGRILNDRARAIDGLRAWAIVLLLFARKGAGREKPLIPVKGASDEQLAQLARKLMALQDVRNPAAHRQTMLRFVDIDAIRADAIHVLGTVRKIFS
jgi:HEAT repeat protein